MGLKGDDNDVSILPEMQDLSVVCFKIPVVDDVKKSRKIAAIHIKYLIQPTDYLIIYSHGNSIDLGF
jgi:hypothetical protein